MVAADSPPPGGGSVSVTRYRPEHLDALTEFYRDIWDADATPTRVASARAQAAARNPVTPGEEVPTYLLMQGTRALGHLSTIPVQVRTATGSRPGYWFIGFMVRPEHRNGPIGYLMLKEASRELELTLSLTVAQASIRLFKAVGFAELGIVPNYLRLLRPDRVLRRIDLDAVGLGGLPTFVRRAVRLAQRPGLAEVAGYGARAALAGWSGLNGPWRTGVERLEGAPDPAALDAMWQSLAPALPNMAWRDGQYLSHRYPIGAEHPYEAVRLTEGGRVRGVAYVRRPKAEGDPRLRGIRIATLSDLIFDPTRPADGLDLLAGAERLARRMGADALLVSGSDRRLPQVLRRRGYLKFPGNLMYLVKDNRRELPGTTSLGDWWVSRGDMNADSVF